MSAADANGHGSASSNRASTDGESLLRHGIQNLLRSVGDVLAESDVTFGATPASR